MAQHSPAPWASKHFKDIADATGDFVAAVSGANSEEAEANGRLILAAPDLLAALKLLAADVGNYEAWQRPCHALDVAIAVIAKAEGRQ